MAELLVRLAQKADVAPASIVCLNRHLDSYPVLISCLHKSERPFMMILMITVFVIVLKMIVFGTHVEEWVKAESKVYSCYETGPCGYWYHRELTKCGAVNYVVASRLLENQRSKRQKSDRLDARALLGNLESYLRGNRVEMSIIAVPSPQQEQQRSVVRFREQLVRIATEPRHAAGGQWGE